MRKAEKSFCTTREVADMLGISVGTAQLWVENGMLRAWKTPGGHRRVTRESVESLLHVRRPSEPARPAINGPLDAMRRLKVLVVEDDAILLRLYDTTLSLWPMSPDVELVDNGIEALLMIERMNPDLLVADLMVPGIDGFKMLQILRRNQRYAAMKIVVVSGLDVAEIARRGTIPEGVTVLPKPVPFAKLLGIAQEAENVRRDSVARSGL